MEKGKNKYLIIIIILIIIMIIMGIIMLRMHNDNTLKSNTIKELQMQNENISTTNLEKNSEKNAQKTIDENKDKNKEDSEEIKEKNNENIDEVSYIMLEIEDESAQGLEYKEKKITDKSDIESIMKLIDSKEKYESNEFVADFGDIPPSGQIHYSNGDIFYFAAGDQIDDDGKVVNLMTGWTKKDQEDKVLYKVDGKLGKLILDIFGE